MKKKKVILCKIEKDSMLWVPFGILYLSDALEKKGFSVELLHIRSNDLNKLYAMARAQNPIFVGFSILTGQALIPTIKASKKIKAMDIPVVWGGAHATILPQLCTKQDYIDYVVMYEGEETACELAEALSNNKSPHNIKGVAYYDNGFFESPKRDFVNLDDYKPDFRKLDLNRYSFGYAGLKTVLPLMTSRGCMFKCGFCFNKGRWRAHSINAVMEQVNYLKENYDIDGIYFNDDIFFINSERSRKIIEMVGLPFFVQARANEITKDTVNWLKKNGCKCVYIGAESGSDKTLRVVNKGITTKDIERAVVNLKGTGIVAQLSFIVGFPNETKKDRQKTYQFIKKLKKINENIDWQLQIYTPYPKTPLWEDAVKNGFKRPDTNEGWSKMVRDAVSLPWFSHRQYVLRRALLFMSIYGVHKQLKVTLEGLKRKYPKASNLQK